MQKTIFFPFAHFPLFRRLIIGLVLILALLFVRSTMADTAQPPVATGINPIG